MRAFGAVVAAVVLMLCACGSPSRPTAAETTKPSPIATATPSEQPLVAPFEALDFIDRSHGWQVILTGPEGAIEVARTSDGGATWSAPVKVTRLSVPEGERAPWLGVRFANSQDGWVFGTGIFATSDGGATWSATSVNAYVFDVAINASSVWALTDAGLYRSQAGTTGWTAMPGAPTKGPGPLQLIRVSGQVAFIAQQAQFQTNLFRTTDAGASWKQLPVPCRGYAMPAATLDGTHLWAVCGSEPGAGNQAKWTYTSDDSGAHWATRAFNDGVNSAGGMTSAGYAHLLALASSTAGVLANNRGDIYRSVDGGRTWKATGLADASEGFYNALQFVDASTGWFAGSIGGLTPDGSVGLYGTTDGGASWKLLTSMPGVIA